MSGLALERMALRLGLREQPLIRKANEYERLLKLKLIGNNKISDSVQAIICLDFAALQFNDSFDSDLALKLAGVRKAVYGNYKRTVGKLLGIDDIVSVNSLCVQYGCSNNIQDLAVDILKYYQDNTVENCDWNHPQYPCMAVYKACKLEKVKISKSKFLVSSRLKSAQWNDLDAKWTKVIEKGNFHARTEGCKMKKKDDTTSIKDIDKANKMNQTVKEQSTFVEDYETWKRRILEQARKDIK
ncbi:origin recognition complex subunit 6-like [Arctopsyche grandis]|uniref:origin recognition complex subunit 6-like n=1 Tax=Arctopsyche grandis TaxID=121162 RepID=UPI00406D8AE6